jgi:hypothetical protein
LLPLKKRFVPAADKEGSAFNAVDVCFYSCCTSAGAAVPVTFAFIMFQ